MLGVADDGLILLACASPNRSSPGAPVGDPNRKAAGWPFITERIVHSFADQMLPQQHGLSVILIPQQSWYTAVAGTGKRLLKCCAAWRLPHRWRARRRDLQGESILGVPVLAAGTLAGLYNQGVAWLQCRGWDRQHQYPHKNIPAASRSWLCLPALVHREHISNPARCSHPASTSSSCLLSSGVRVGFGRSSTPARLSPMIACWAITPTSPPARSWRRSRGRRENINRHGTTINLL